MIENQFNRSSHPFLLPNVDDAPDILLKQIRSILSKEEEISGIFVIPQEVYIRGFRWETNPLQALVFTQNGVLQVFGFDTRHKIKKAIWISNNSVIKMKLSLVLLYGKLEIWGVTDGQELKITAEYNTVAHRYLSPLIKQFIRQTWNPPKTNGENLSPESTFDDFIHTSYSFYNGIMLEAKQPDEVIRGFAYQPELRGRWMKIFKTSIYPRTLLVLTNQQIILLQEDLNYKAHHEWIFTFIPIHRISAIDINSYKEWQEVALRLIPEMKGLDISLLVENETISQWQKIVDLL